MANIRHYATLSEEKTVVNDGLESIVIMKDLADIPGGVVLNVTGQYEATGVIPAGTLIGYNDETGYFPNPSDADDLVGVLKHSVLTKDPRAAVMTMGQVNAAVILENELYSEEELKTYAAKLPQINFAYMPKGAAQ